ncbi:MAG: N-acetylcysteine deacetylase [Candidatus Celerinatantimonas neptuna]|nr:MAG: N-acetylcysteine deacetylase [Candidatus Celerinatantimonas neptuna]
MIHSDEHQKLITIRHDLHKIAELSGSEFQTQTYIRNQLRLLPSPPTISTIADSGIIACFNSHIPGPSVLLRADMDALPIQELAQHCYVSMTPGVSHLCGHDGHTTSLLGVARLLSRKPISRGAVWLLFQPAEETGQGAQAVITELQQKNIKLDYVFAYHNLPGYPLGQLVIRENSFTAAVQSIAIQLHGQTAHAAEPESGNCPAWVIEKLINFAKQFSNNCIKYKAFRLITPICIKMGEPAYGTMPGNAEIHFTLRCFGNRSMDELSNQFIEYFSAICSEYQISFDYQWLDIFRACDNHQESVALLEMAGRRLEMSIMYPSEPFKWGEDFGCFTENFQGAMFGLGAGEGHSALHHVDYDYPDSLLLPSVKLFELLTRQICC